MKNNNDQSTTPHSLSRKGFLLGGGLLALGGAALAATGCTDAPSKNNPEKKAEITNVTANASAEGSYQLQRTYPVLPGDDGFDDSVVVNETATFITFAGQGKLLIKADDPSSFSLYVNGVTVPVDTVSKDSWTAVDISPATRNGNNRLQVSCLDWEKTIDVRIPYPELVDATGDYEDNDNFKLLDEIIRAEIDQGFTSAQVLVARDGRILHEGAFGLCNSYSPDGTRLEEGDAVTSQTLYDLASNTKMYATNFAVQQLASQGKLDVTKLVSEYIPAFKDRPEDAIKGKDSLTVQEILEHQAGFPADPQYHNIDYDPASGKTVSKSRANAALFTQDRSKALQKIIETPLEYAPGTKTRYSDVDYMLLGFIVEQISGTRLDEFARKEFYGPLGLEHTTFNPLDNGFSVSDCAATELNGNTRDGVISFDNVRTDTIQGQVHDEKAYYTMGGVSGHAGLFSCAHDLAVLCQVIINRGGYGEHALFNEDILDQFIKPKATDPSYGLGWRRKAHSVYSWAFSPLSDTSTVGHTGWTGTLTVIDPVQHAIFILLTNAKNSPVLDKQANPNDFVGNHYLTSGYGLPATLAFDHEGDSKQANASKLIDLVQAKCLMISGPDGSDTVPDRAELGALTSVAKNRSDGTALEKFMKTDVWKQATELASQK